MNRRHLVFIAPIFLISVLILVLTSTRRPAAAQAAPEQTFFTSDPVAAGSSRPVREISTSPLPILYTEINPLRNPGLFQTDFAQKGSNTSLLDPLAAASLNPAGETPGLLFAFEGLGTDGFAPPDTVGDVGPNHYVQMVNVSFAVFDKSGNLLTGPTPFNSLFSGIGGRCQIDNDGDPIVLYDPLADRWLLSQFAVSGAPETQCIAISQTPDPTGAYWLYAFPMPDFPDYPKFGVWPDAYYMGTNTGFPNQYYAHAFDRNAMLNGLPATVQSVSGQANFLMPADIDGPNPPPTGSPGLFYTFYKNGYVNHPPGEDRIEVYEFDVDWATPANTTFTSVDTIPIAAFNYTVCGFFAQNCVPQPGTAQRLDTLSYWPMFRLAYRNLLSHISMVGTFTVDLDGTDKAAPRWFELRQVGGAWTLYQEGTYAPDSDHRFMGSIAMDGSGNLALGYSVSSTTTKPAIRYALQNFGDPLGTLQTEASLIEGNGVQTGIARWGDYAAMSVDPADECSFWLTSEYHDATDTGFDWNTRVGVFKDPTCTGTIGPFSIQANPKEQAVCAPADAAFNLNLLSFGGFSDPVTLTASGNPAGTTAGFSVNPVIPPGFSILTISSTGAGTPGSYPIDVVGTAPTFTMTTTVTLDLYTAAPGIPILTSPADGATGVNLVPTFQWSAATQALTHTLQVATDAGFSNIVYSAGGINGNSHQLAGVLDPLTMYFWRVRSDNICGAGSFSQPFKFTTADIPSILLVDDDDDAPDVQSSWTAALDALGVAYDIWVTGPGDVEPSGSDLAPYSTVLWFTGDRFGSANSGPAGPRAITEAALSTWLDGGGCLFISSQDYRYDKGLTAFMTSRLGVTNVTNDDGDYNIVTGQNVFTGLGPYTLSFPYTDFTDPITVGNGGVQAMLGDNGRVAGVSKDAGTYRTSFWAFGLETLPPAGRQDSLSAFLTWCQPPAPTSTPTSTSLPPTATNTPTELPPTLTSTPLPPTATNTPLPPTLTNTPVPPTLTSTPLPPTLTSTPLPPTATNTPLPPTATNTPTELPPTLTSTPLPPTATSTPLPPTLTNTPVPPTLTSTPLPPTATNTLLPPTLTSTPLPPTATHTPLPPTATNTPTLIPPTTTSTPLPPTATNTPTPTPTAPPPTATFTPTATQTASIRVYLPITVRSDSTIQLARAKSAAFRSGR